MKFNVEKRIITSQPEQIISYAVDYTAEFEFDEEWTDKVITARFVKNGAYIDVVLENNKCMIPLFSAGSVYVGCFTDTFTSTYIKMDVDGSVKDLGNIPAIPPDADAYNQLIGMIEAGRIKGDPGEPGPQGEPGKDGEPGRDGSDYTITEADYQAIADRVPQPDLSDYVKTTDYASDTKGGVIKPANGLELTASGYTTPKTYTFSRYNNERGDNTFISKGTLENVLNERMKEPQFELIEEITLTEDVAKIERATEPNGTPYNFKKMAFDIKVPKVANNDRLKLFYNTNVEDYKKYGAEISNGLNASYVALIGIVWRIENGLFISEWASPINNKTTESYIKGFSGLKFVDSLTSVFITSNTDLPSGTNIKIYAVRG